MKLKIGLIFIILTLFTSNIIYSENMLIKAPDFELREALIN